MVLCRGCCCGTEAKHPNFDHEGQLRQVAAAASAAGVLFSVASCLDECEHSNNVLVRQRHGSKSEDVLIGQLLDPDLTSALCDWLTGPAGEELPQALVERRFTRRPRRPPLAARYAAGLEDSLTCPVAARHATPPDANDSGKC